MISSSCSVKNSRRLFSSSMTCSFFICYNTILKHYTSSSPIT